MLILVKSNIPSSQIKCNSPIELIWLCNTDNNIIIGSFYYPPHPSVTILAQSLSDVRTMYPSARIILGGDFNSPGINWLNRSIYLH